MAVPTGARLRAEPAGVSSRRTPWRVPSARAARSAGARSRSGHPIPTCCPGWRSPAAVEPTPPNSMVPRPSYDIAASRPAWRSELGDFRPLRPVPLPGVVEDLGLCGAAKQHDARADRVERHHVSMTRHGPRFLPLRPGRAIPLPGVAQLVGFDSAEQHDQFSRVVAGHGVIGSRQMAPSPPPASTRRRPRSMCRRDWWRRTDLRRAPPAVGRRRRPSRARGAPPVPFRRPASRRRHPTPRCPRGRPRPSKPPKSTTRCRAASYAIAWLLRDVGPKCSRWVQNTASMCQSSSRSPDRSRIGIPNPSGSSSRSLTPARRRRSSPTRSSIAGS